MALKIRLARAGAKKRPFYRVVVAESSSPRDGRFIEKVGTYNPMVPKEHKDRLNLVEERIKHWLSVGAQPTDRVARFLGQAKIIEMPAMRESPQRSQPKAKAQERVKERAEKAEAAKAAEKEAKQAAAEAKQAAAEAKKAEKEAAKEEAAQAKAEEVAAETKAEAPQETSKPEAKAEEPVAEEKPAEEKKEESQKEEIKED